MAALDLHCAPSLAVGLVPGSVPRPANRITGCGLVPTCVGTSPFLSSSGRWSEVGDWISLQAHMLPMNMSSQRYCPAPSVNISRAIHRHVQYVSKQLQQVLVRQFWSSQYDSVSLAAATSDSSKLSMLALRLQQPGPPVHVSLDGFALPNQRAVVASFLCADWFFGKYAKNYFARNLLPRTPAHLKLVEDAGVDPRSVCLTCWHHRRQVFLENEFHAVCVCPSHDKARQDLLQELPDDFVLNRHTDVCRLLCCGNEDFMKAVGDFFTRVRQTRRKHKCTFERLNDKVCIKSFACKRAAWRLRGRYSCRHGILFATPPVDGCKCMEQHSTEDAWLHARYMPALDQELKCIVAVPFSMATRTRLSTLQAEARRLLW